MLLASFGHLGDFNSVYGHIAGDAAIIAISNIIKDSIRSNDIAARYGNQFVIVFPDATPEKIAVVANRICKKMKEEKFKGKDPTPVIRIGISSFPKDGKNEKKHQPVEFI